jgi:hypothetical protein
MGSMASGAILSWALATGLLLAGFGATRPAVASEPKLSDGGPMVMAADATPSHGPTIATGSGSPGGAAFYGWANLLTGAGGIGLVSLVLAVDDGDAQELFFLWGAAIYTVGGSVAHGCNDELGKAFASLGMRVGAGVAGMLVGLSAAQACDVPEECEDRMIYGGLIGAGAATLVDGLVLGWTNDEHAADGRGTSVRIHAAASGHNLALGLGGVF